MNVRVRLRELLLVVLMLGVIGCKSVHGPADSLQTEPVVYMVERGAARVYIFGFGEAHDRSWLTPTVKRALDESQEVWFETPQGNPSNSNVTLLAQQLGIDKDRPLADALDSTLLARTLAAADELKIDRKRLEFMRPWLAREAIQRAYQASGKAAAVEEDYADAVISQLAVAAGKKIRTEYASIEDVVRFFAGMSDAAQREYLRNMLDYMDDAEKGLHARHEEWIVGRPNTDSIDKMRIETPALYDAMHTQRNKQWAIWIDDMLSRGGTYLVVAGLNHTLGPESIQVNLERRGMKVQRVSKR